MIQGRKIAALIVAAGEGTRMGAKTPKQFLEIEGRAMQAVTAEAFDRHPLVDHIYVAAHPDFVARTQAALGDLAKMRRVVAGGDTRQATVRLGLQAVAEDLSVVPDEAENAVVLIHDGARPFVDAGTISRVAKKAAETGAAVACVPVTDTIYVAEEGLLAASPERDKLFSVQTPQGFHLPLVMAAHEMALAKGVAVTDDGIPVRGSGHDVAVVQGDYGNRKITIREDLEGLQMQQKTGIGFDVHRFAAGRPLILGGVHIPCDRGLAGHSDADALTHALMDALLGAMGMGDIGRAFPDTDPAYAGISSLILLERVCGWMEERALSLINADLIIIAEKPRMAEYLDAMEANLAKATGTDPKRINVKATTTEGLGFAGREEGIGAQAVVLLGRSRK